PRQEGHFTDVFDALGAVRGRERAGVRRDRKAHEVLRPDDRKAHRAEACHVAVSRAKVRSIGAARSPVLGTAMFAPSVLYIVLLIGAPFVLAVLYAFSDARIGSTAFHFVGLENFRSILRSPSFQKALRNSIVFTLCAQAIVIVCSNILSIALEKPFRGR